MEFSENLDQNPHYLKDTTEKCKIWENYEVKHIGNRVSSRNLLHQQKMLQILSIIIILSHFWNLNKGTCYYKGDKIESKQNNNHFNLIGTKFIVIGKLDNLGSFIGQKVYQSVSSVP